MDAAAAQHPEVPGNDPDEDAGPQLRAAIDRIRVGATVDIAGTIRRHHV
jgi:hypothetical protein